MERATKSLHRNSIGHGFITSYRLKEIKLPTRKKAYEKMDRRIVGKQREEYPHNKEPFCNID
jgi:hypothetical protein